VSVTGPISPGVIGSVVAEPIWLRADVDGGGEL
jgi:hypothetical protein